MFYIVILTLLTVFIGGQLVGGNVMSCLLDDTDDLNSSR